VCRSESHFLVHAQAGPGLKVKKKGLGAASLGGGGGCEVSDESLTPREQQGGVRKGDLLTLNGVTLLKKAG